MLSWNPEAAKYKTTEELEVAIESLQDFIVLHATNDKNKGISGVGIGLSEDVNSGLCAVIFVHEEISEEKCVEISQKFQEEEIPHRLEKIGEIMAL